jgi:hypothetical protein
MGYVKSKFEKFEEVVTTDPPSENRWYKVTTLDGRVFDNVPLDLGNYLTELERQIED